MRRPRPVVIYGAVMAALVAVTESADAADLMPASVFPWVRVVLLVMTAVGGALVTQSQVTPVSSPMNDAGQRLVPMTVRRGDGPAV